MTIPDIVARLFQYMDEIGMTGEERLQLFKQPNEIVEMTPRQKVFCFYYSDIVKENHIAGDDMEQIDQTIYKMLNKKAVCETA